MAKQSKQNTAPKTAPAAKATPNVRTKTINEVCAVLRKIGAGHLVDAVHEHMQRKA